MMMIVSPHSPEPRAQCYTSVSSALCPPGWRSSIRPTTGNPASPPLLSSPRLGTKIFLDFSNSESWAEAELWLEVMTTQGINYCVRVMAGGCLSNFRKTTLCPVHHHCPPAPLLSSENRFRQNKWWDEASSLTGPGLSGETTVSEPLSPSRGGGHLLTVFQTPLWDSWSTLLTNRQTWSTRHEDLWHFCQT